LLALGVDRLWHLQLAEKELESRQTIVTLQMLKDLTRVARPTITRLIACFGPRHLTDAPHYIENTGDTDLIFLETFASAEFSDVSLNQWLRRAPSEMLKAHLNIDKETAMKIPAEKLEVI
jgi:hypothetical protein